MSVTIYAPTNCSAGGACLEATTIHQRATNQATTQHYQGFWDWCTNQNAIGTSEFITSWHQPNLDLTDAGVANSYIRTMSTGKPSLLVQVLSTSPSNPTGGCWQGLLYNFFTAQWTNVTGSICGSSQTGTGTIGWTMYEDYNYNTCTSIPGVRASSIVTLGTDGTWYGEYISGWNDIYGSRNDSCFGKGTWGFNAPSSDGANAWHAYTPGS